MSRPPSPPATAGGAVLRTLRRLARCASPRVRAWAKALLGGQPAPGPPRRRKPTTH
jgi:hypothetical protein